tara:strand:+ start:253 stop:540 length:288 start_codon:yes stop_codon:yes gene_type:complete
MKNYGTIKFPKGTVGFLSQNGYNNWWYPDPNNPITIPMDVSASHLSLWMHQDPYLAFKVPRVVFHPTEIESYKDSYVCVWFWKEEVDGLISIEND